MPAINVAMDGLSIKHQFVKQAKVQELTCMVVGDGKKSWNVNWNYSYFGQWGCFVCVIKNRSGIYD